MTTLARWFSRTAEAFARRPALQDAATRVTYGELAVRSDALAGRLRACGVRVGDRVVLGMDRSVHAVTAMVACLKAGAVYVPLDPGAPVQRWETVIADCEPQAVVCESATRDRVSGRVDPARTLIAADACVPKADEGPDPDLPAGSPDHLAYLIYTSGTTGVPKGVMIPHKAVASYIRWAQEYFNITSSEHLLATSPFHFDMSVFDIFGAILTGACVSIVPARDLIFPAAILSTIEARGVTLWKAAASMLAHCSRVGALKPGRIPTLRQVIFSGEPLPVNALGQWMAAYPEKRYFNAYGPSECTGISSCDAIPVGEMPAPAAASIGRPCSDTRFWILTEDGREAETGEAGELMIASAGLCDGYWRRPSLTAQRFIANPLDPEAGSRVYLTGDRVARMPDGRYRFISRQDDQVKHQGYRIELGEIDQALAGGNGIREAAAVLVRRTDSEETRLVGVYVSDLPNAEKEVRRALAEALPRYMHPQVLMAVDAVPRTAAGKLDRQALTAWVSREVR